MSDCDLQIQLDRIIAAYVALGKRCCVVDTSFLEGFPDDLSTLCGDGDFLPFEIWRGTKNAVNATPDTCQRMVENADFVRPEDPHTWGCITQTKLIGMAEWIENIVCGPTCHNCEPPLEWSYPITLAGLPTPYTGWNGAHVVQHRFTSIEECVWTKIVGAVTLQLVWDTVGTGVDPPPFWRILLFTTVPKTLCVVGWKGPTQLCTVPGIYTYYFCTDTQGEPGSLCESLCPITPAPTAMVS